MSYLLNQLKIFIKRNNLNINNIPIIISGDLNVSPSSDVIYLMLGNKPEFKINNK